MYDQRVVVFSVRYFSLHFSKKFQEFNFPQSLGDLCNFIYTKEPDIA